MSDPAGCTIELNWMEKNPWILGLLCLVIGPVLALFGKLYFFMVTLVTIAASLMAFILILGMSLEYDSTSGGLVLLCCLASIIAIETVLLLKSKKHFIEIALGLVTGYYLGMTIFAILAVLFKWSAVGLTGHGRLEELSCVAS